MPAKDFYHDTVRTALEKDGWTITEDPLTLSIGSRSVYIDLGARKLLAANKGELQIAVEIKSFIGNSPVRELETALGQYLLYSQILEEQKSHRVLYLAISQTIYMDLFSEAIGELIIRKNHLNLVVFNIQNKEITKWIT
ncbi:MAG: XisH family protein [Chamaesiphon sp.]|nr:XisH family protein [Chamaesiphon sp.]